MPKTVVEQETEEGCASQCVCMWCGHFYRLLWGSSVFATATWRNTAAPTLWMECFLLQGLLDRDTLQIMRTAPRHSMKAPRRWQQLVRHLAGPPGMDAERMCDTPEGLIWETRAPALIVGQHSLCPGWGDSLLPAFRLRLQSLVTQAAAKDAV